MNEVNNKTFTLHSGASAVTFIATADVHLDKKLYNEPELEEDFKDNFVRLVELAIEKQVQYLVIAGDLFESNTVKPHSIVFVTKLVDKLKLHGITTVGIAGDHDKPLKHECWYRIAKILPVTVEPTFAGLDYFDYSTVSTEELIGLLKKGREVEKVQWLFLHCQFPQLYTLAQPKKIIDYNSLMPFENFPNLQGIIAGDLHFGPETRLFGLDKTAYVGYPGSPTVGDISENNQDKHVLYCNGKTLTHIPFPQQRQMRKIDYRGDKAVNFDVSEQLVWAREQKLRPVFYIQYDRNSEKYLNKITALYDHAIIHPHQLQLGEEANTENPSLSCRSEASSDEKVDKALRNVCGKKTELFKLASDLLANDPKTVLDEFKLKFEL